MSTIKKLLLLLLGIYLILGGVLYAFQSKLIFQPETLPADYHFNFDNDFEELTLFTSDSVALNALLFKTADPRGVVFYLHGNAGALNGWGLHAGKFLEEGYDVFILDYRGYGKSDGEVKNETTFYQDIQMAYNMVREHYEEEKIIVLGYSIATATAAKIASENHPKSLILKAPYYSFRDLLKDHPLGKVTRIYPASLIKFDFPTYQYLEKCKVPVTIFHGDEDRIIAPASSEKLKSYLKPGDKYFLLPGVRHNDIPGDETYRAMLKIILE